MRRLVLVVCLVGCGAEDVTPPREVGPPGGATTVIDRSSGAFTRPAPNLSDDELELHGAGDIAFEATFVTAPAPVNAGLGPMFNNVGCGACHVHNGRGMPAVGDPLLRSHMLVRVSLASGEPSAPGGVVPVPGLGEQLQDHAVFGAQSDADIALSWVEEAGQYDDGVIYSLRRPVVSITLADGSLLSDDVMRSLRGAPPVFGLGLLEAVPEDDIVALADPDDADGDGISGRPNYVWDPETATTTLGRFGLKANNPSLHVQAAAAFANDMGVTSPVFPDAGEEVDADTLAAAAFYTQTLGVPARAAMSDAAHEGERLFARAGCGGCHEAELTTGTHVIAALSVQKISPYTDMLLHDMGEGLADGRPDFVASGSEWRTAPLWGIGLTHTVLPYSGFLHDGRARTLEEAILWHGGEAAAAREAFVGMSATDRAALLAFLGSL